MSTYAATIFNIENVLVTQITDTEITNQISAMLASLPPFIAPAEFSGDYLLGPRGFVWSNLDNYVIDDIVNFSGTIYKCTADNLNMAPPDILYWNVASEEEIKQYQVTQLDAFMIRFQSIVAQIIDRANDQNSGLPQAAFNFIIAINSYYTFEAMIPQPDYFQTLVIPDPGALIYESLDAINNFRTNFVGYADDFYFTNLGVDGFPGGLTVSYGTSGQLETEISDLAVGGESVAAKKTNDLQAFANTVTAMNLKIGVEFMFDEKTSIELTQTKQDRANRIYRAAPVGIGMEDFITIHGLDIPIY